MARSVSTPTGALQVAYATLPDDADEFSFEDSVSDIRREARRRYPSLRSCSDWVGREDRAILANDQAFITVSEYCGLVALCAVPKNESKKAVAWCEKVALGELVGYFGDRLISKGRFSNGEQIFIRADLSNRENISSNGSRW